MAATDASVRVLLVEDDPADRDLVLDLLGAASDPRFTCTTAQTASEALVALSAGGFDALLLDLGLPDREGTSPLAALEQILAATDDVPVVVLTGMDDDALGVAAVRAGAQDYLYKGHVTGQLLTRTIRHAVERHGLRRALELERERRAQDLERLALAGLTARAGVTAELYGALTIAELAPRSFAQLRDEYAAALEAALEVQIKRVDYDVSGALAAVADRLGELGGGPRDVIELHKAALARVCVGAPRAKVSALTAEGRFAALQLMGHLVSYYRRYSTRAERAAREAAAPPGSRGGHGSEQESA